MCPTPCPGPHGTLGTPRSPRRSPTVPSSGDTTLWGPSILSAHGLCSAWTDPARSDSGPVPRARSKYPMGLAAGGPIVPGCTAGAVPSKARGRSRRAWAWHSCPGDRGTIAGATQGRSVGWPRPPRPPHSVGSGAAGPQVRTGCLQGSSAVTPRGLVKDPVQLAAARWITQPCRGRCQAGMWQHRAPVPRSSGEQIQAECFPAVAGAFWCVFPRSQPINQPGPRRLQGFCGAGNPPGIDRQLQPEGI